MLLVRKTHPEWQAGKLNGVGGKLDPCDLGSPMRAMVREFTEETRIVQSEQDWLFLATLHSGPHLIHFFRALFDIETLQQAAGQPNDTGELLELHDVTELAARRDKIANLSFLVPFAAYTHDLYRKVELEEIDRSAAPHELEQVPPEGGDTPAAELSGIDPSQVGAAVAGLCPVRRP